MASAAQRLEPGTRVPRHRMHPAPELDRSQWRTARTPRRPRERRRRRTSVSDEPSSHPETTNSRHSAGHDPCTEGGLPGGAAMLTSFLRCTVTAGLFALAACATAQPPAVVGQDAPKASFALADGGDFPSRRHARRRRRARLLHHVLPELSRDPSRGRQPPRSQRGRWAQGHRGERGRHVVASRRLDRQAAACASPSRSTRTAPLRRSSGSSRFRRSSSSIDRAPFATFTPAITARTTAPRSKARSLHCSCRRAPPTSAD